MKVFLFIFMLGITIMTPNVYAKHIEVTAEMIENVLYIEIVESSGYQMTDEQIMAEDEAIQRLTSEEVLIDTGNNSVSTQEKIHNTFTKLKADYDIEEVFKNGEKYWKCVPKNPKMINVKKSKYTEYTDSQGNSIHSTEYYTEEELNPEYISDEKELEKKTLWVKIIEKDVIGKNEEESDTEKEGIVVVPDRKRGFLGSIFR